MFECFLCGLLGCGLGFALDDDSWGAFGDQSFCSAEERFLGGFGGGFRSDAAYDTAAGDDDRCPARGVDALQEGFEGSGSGAGFAVGHI
ncbi:hypothetical protein DVB88_10835 [Tsukamurella pulmonis]|nr:hypothetical protein DVB88_10835 [Tsukamurella pulmonis]